MPGPVLTVLIATLPERQYYFQSLVRDLLKQTESYGGRVTVTALRNNGERPLGVIRDQLMAAADSEYTCFVDDDDRLPPYYLSEIVPLLDGVDQVGWRVQMTTNGKLERPAYHSLEYAGWWEDERGYYRDISHLCPVRRALALEHARFYPVERGSLGVPMMYGARGVQLGVPEDTLWCTQMRGHVKTEHRVDFTRVMYYYDRVPARSRWHQQGLPPQPDVLGRPAIDHPNFSWHLESTC